MVGRNISSGLAPYNTAEPRRRTNRTAGTLVKGSVGMVDDLLTDGDSTTIQLAMDNIVAVSTARISARCPLVVFCGDSCVDNEQGNFAEAQGDAIVQVLVNSTTNIAAGDFLKPVDASDSLVKNASAANPFVVDESGSVSDTLTISYARALEARTADDEGLIWCRLYSHGIR